MTNVVHCKKEKYDVYIGRPSKWGNPFEIGKDGTCEEVIEKYVDWFFSQEDLINSIHELAGKTLGCWCKSKACHGDFLEDLGWYYHTRHMYPEGERNLGRFYQKWGDRYDLEEIYGVV